MGNDFPAKSRAFAGLMVALARLAFALAAHARCQEAPPGPLHAKPGAAPEKTPPIDEKHATSGRWWIS